MFWLDRPTSLIPRTVALACSAVLLACSDNTPSSATPPLASVAGRAIHGHSATGLGDLGARALRDIAALRAATAPFHRLEAADAAGWDTQITGCMADPTLGAMGFHYGNTGLIDGIVELLRPELLLYEPIENGRLRFVGVEYIVPYTAWSGATPPSLLGQSFHRNDGFGLWVLHVWHFRHNPRGIFEDWNPDVTCLPAL